MRRPCSISAIVMFTGIVCLLSDAGAAEFNYDQVHSSISFKARHLDISWIHGRFNEAEGKFSIDKDDPAKSWFQLSIKADSIDTANKARDEHLRQPDYFDTKQFPTIDFKSTSVKPVKGGYEVTGNFTMHGKTKKVVLDITGGKEIDWMGKNHIGFSTEVTLKRSDFDFDKSQIGLIGDEARIYIDFEGVQQ
ncbi:MAG TPA: YceI family protein [Pirellulales bacterium]|nr:YceI family protein [Pirellulales bacterium]